MGQYDIPAVINYILVRTGREKLVYIGHSMGTTIFWVAMETHPTLNDKIEMMFALAPVASVNDMKSPIKLLAPFVHQIQVGYCGYCNCLIINWFIVSLSSTYNIFNKKKV